MGKPCTTRWVLISLAAGLFVASGCQQTGQKKEGNPIKVGVYLAMTGGQASFGQSSNKGITLAVEEINAGGGVLGRPMEVVLEDDRSQAAEANTASLKLIQQDKVVALLGEVASSSSLAA